VPLPEHRAPSVDDATTLLFVYGTLKHGRWNHRLIADQRFVREAVTEPRYRLVDIGSYPGLVRDDAYGLAVMGELWAVGRCCLLELDDFEGDEYARGPVTVAGMEQSVQTYFWARPVPPGARSGDEWPLG
jgi:gamma-glutamylaminecyclotransferase